MDARTFAGLFLISTGSLLGCSQNDPPVENVTAVAESEEPMPNQPEQKITALTEADQQRLRDQRAVVEQYLGDADSLEKYKTSEGKLGTIRAILEGGVFQPDQTEKLQCLGIVLGDVFVQEMGMEWIMVEDEFGRDPAVRLPQTSIILYPMTMISKRIERGEDVDVFDLYNGTVDQVEALMGQAQ